LARGAVITNNGAVATYPELSITVQQHPLLVVAVLVSLRMPSSYQDGNSGSTCIPKPKTTYLMNKCTFQAECFTIKAIAAGREDASSQNRNVDETDAQSD